MPQVVVASFLSDTFKAQAKGESPLGSTPGGSSGAGSAPGSTPGSALGGQRPPTARSEPKTSSGMHLWTRGWLSCGCVCTGFCSVLYIPQLFTLLLQKLCC